jgi:hypothetical protein
MGLHACGGGVDSGAGSGLGSRNFMGTTLKKREMLYNDWLRKVRLLLR